MDSKPHFSAASPDSLSPERDAKNASRRSVRALSTRDHSLIRRWAERHKAEPATGEATASGPATVSVNDGGAGVRFNFPGAARFRPIEWDEWFENFERHALTFVYEEEVADRAYEFFQARGEQHGQDLADWFAAEQQMQKPGTSNARYRLIKE